MSEIVVGPPVAPDCGAWPRWRSLRRHVHDPLARAINGLKSLPPAIKAGSFGGIGAANSAFDALKGSASGAGATIKDR